MNYLTRDLNSTRTAANKRMTMIERALGGDPVAQMYCVKCQIDTGAEGRRLTSKGTRL